MEQTNTATLRNLLRYALPIGTTVVTGDLETNVNWAVMVRAGPPAFPEIYGGELALVSMDLLRSYDSRIRLSEVIRALGEAHVSAIAVQDVIADDCVQLADQYGLVLMAIPASENIAAIERAVNKLILNQSAQLTERAIEIQRQLTRLAAENRDLNSLLQVMARSIGKPIVVHDDAGVLIDQVYPGTIRRNPNGRTLLQGAIYNRFLQWLQSVKPNGSEIILESPIGYTTILHVEKRIAGYLSIIGEDEELDEFTRLIVTYGADVCAIEMAKTRAVASAVEQTRGDWVQMWLSGSSPDDDLLRMRAQQSGFDLDEPFLVAIFRAVTEAGQALPLESFASLVRDDLARRQINGAVGQYVDVVVALYPVTDLEHMARVRQNIEEVRMLLASRTPSGLVTAGISHVVDDLSQLRNAYREAKDAVNITVELGDVEQTTFYGDLKLYQLLLALKALNIAHLQRFYEDTLERLILHDERKQSELIQTLNGFFEANGNLAKAAQELAVHRNTLVYRLERISELTNMDLDDADNRLILHLALKIQRVLATTTTREAPVNSNIT